MNISPSLPARFTVPPGRSRTVSQERSVENVLRDAEIAQLGRHRVRQQNVLRLQVPVENLVPVEVGHSGADLPRDDEDAAEIFRPCAEVRGCRIRVL